jgi:hypothetical protein
LIEGDRIIVSGKVLNRTTHQTAFGVPGCAHTSPITTTVNGRHVSLFHTGGIIVCDAANGTQLCRISGGNRGPGTKHNTSEAIVFGGDKIFLWMRTGVVQLNATATALTPVWTVPVMDKQENPRTPVIWGDLVFVQYKGTTCMDLKTGKVLWTAGVGGGSYLAADGKVLVYSGKTIRMINASPDGFSEVGTPLVLPGGKDWAAPSLSHGRVYVRAGNQIVCYAVGPDVAPRADAPAPATAPATTDRPGVNAQQ